MAGIDRPWRLTLLAIVIGRLLYSNLLVSSVISATTPKSRGNHNVKWIVIYIDKLFALETKQLDPIFDPPMPFND